MAKFGERFESSARIAFINYGGDFSTIASQISKVHPEIKIFETGTEESFSNRAKGVSQGFDLVFLAFNYSDLSKRESNFLTIIESLTRNGTMLIAFGIVPPVGYRSVSYQKIKKLKVKYSPKFSPYIELDLNKYRIYHARSEKFIQENGYYAIYRSVSAITNIVRSTGFVNVDFADVRTVLRGRSVIGTGYGTGESRIRMALFSAFQEIALQANPAFAKSVLINVVGGSDFALFEYHEIQKSIHEIVSKDSIIIVGFTEAEAHNDYLEITIILSSDEGVRIEKEQLYKFDSDDDDSSAFANEVESLIGSASKFKKPN